MPRERKSSSEYEVGYGKPPQHTQFKPGVSGNPKGRKKGDRNLKSVLEEEFARLVAFNEGGKPQKRSTMQVIVRQHMVKAAKGDTKSMIALFGLAQRTGLVGLDDVAEPIVQMPLSPDEEALLRETIAEMKAEKSEREAPR